MAKVELPLEDFRKKPLDVCVAHFTVDPYTNVGEITVPGVEVDLDWIEFERRSPCYCVWNPGARAWLPLTPGCYIIFAPTGCRYPVREEQFLRNYEKANGPSPSVILSALEKAGVDNWEGYSIAMRELYGDEEED